MIFFLQTLLWWFCVNWQNNTLSWARDKSYILKSTIKNKKDKKNILNYGIENIYSGM